jgi:DNA-binding response OmpR family regulator
MPAVPAAYADRPVLVVEDDADLAGLLRLHLGDLGLEVETRGHGTEGLNRALEANVSLVILDIMLPGLDGFEVCKRLRAEKPHVPILMLTSKSEELDKVLGLELGADDYITKPFSIRELLARVKALFRRIELDRAEARGADARPVQHGDLVVYPTKRKATLRGEALDLTHKEFELLLLFARHPGRAYSRQELLDEVWGYQYGGYSHTVNTHINRLRGKLEDDPSNPQYVQTVWGVGYRFAELDDLPGY